MGEDQVRRESVMPEGEQAGSTGSGTAEGSPAAEACTGNGDAARVGDDRTGSVPAGDKEGIAGPDGALWRKRLLTAGLVLVLLAVLSLCWRYLRKEEIVEHADAGVVPVAVAAAEQGDVESVVTLSGRVAAEVEMQVIPKIAGRVKGVFADVGDRVRQGQILVKIDDAEIAAAVSQADAGLAVAEAGARIAAANLEDARRNLERMQQLYDSGAISLQQLEQAQLGYDSAAAGVSEAQVRQAQAAVESARLQLANTVVTSPVDGLVTARYADPGSMTGPAQPLMTLVAIDNVQVEVNVPEDDINKLAPGQQVPVKVAAAGEQPFTGKITGLAPAADARSKMFPVKIAIPNSGHKLKPGMFAEVELVTEIRRSVTRIPLDAVIEKDGRKTVYVVDGEKVREHQVETGVADSKNVEIRSGLRPGDRIVVSGQEFLTDGSRVKVTAETGAGKAAAGREKGARS